MTFIFTCSVCHRNLRATDAMVGRLVRCPACGFINTVPGLDQVPEANRLPANSMAAAIQSDTTPTPPPIHESGELEPSPVEGILNDLLADSLSASRVVEAPSTPKPIAEQPVQPPQPPPPSPTTSSTPLAPVSPPSGVGGETSPPAPEPALPSPAVKSAEPPAVFPPRIPAHAEEGEKSPSTTARSSTALRVMTTLFLVSLGINILSPLIWYLTFNRLLTERSTALAPAIPAAITPQPVVADRASPTEMTPLTPGPTPLQVAIAGPTPFIPDLRVTPAPMTIETPALATTPASPASRVTAISAAFPTAPPRFTPTPLAVPQPEDTKTLIAASIPVPATMAAEPLPASMAAATPAVEPSPTLLAVTQAPPPVPIPATAPAVAGVEVPATQPAGPIPLDRLRTVWRVTQTIPKPVSTTPDGAQIDKLQKQLAEQVLVDVEAHINNKTLPAAPKGDLRPDWWFRMIYRGEIDMGIWALIASGVDPKDPRLQKVLKNWFELGPGEYTYGLSFRVNALSHLYRRGSPEVARVVRPLLVKEAQLLAGSCNANGSYGYEVVATASHGSMRRHDNSNSQFGAYGTGAAGEALIELPADFWPRVDQYWKNCQLGDGGWAYATWLRTTSYQNMTDAGMNSLYLCLDNYWSQFPEGGYTWLKGFKYRTNVLAQMQKTFACLDRGWAWYSGPASPAPDLTGLGSSLYSAYGLQRLGLTSGRKRIGGRIWVPDVFKTAWTSGAIAGNLEENSWRLLLISFGRAPVIFNKLKYGEEQDWNYYFRDVSQLTRWISDMTERQQAWQSVSLEDDYVDLQDAPILIITGSKALKFPPPQEAKLRRFLDHGGTVFLNPNLDSAEFKTSAKELFTRLYKDEGYEFAGIPKDHPLYTGSSNIAAAGGKPGKPEATTRIPLLGMNDGGRYFAILCDGDIAGAWQLRMFQTLREVFEIMLNLRLYAAPDMQDLPPRWREVTLPPPLMSGAGNIKLARLKHAGHSTACRELYAVLDQTIAWQGTRLQILDQVVPAADSLNGVDIIHITGHNGFVFPPGEVAAIRKAVENGALLIIDPANGKPAFIDSARELVKQLGLIAVPIDTKPGSIFAGGAKGHPLFSGIKDLHPNKWMTLGLKDAPFRELQLNGRPVGLYAEVDFSASATGQHVFGYPAIGPEAARQLWANLIWNAVRQP